MPAANLVILEEEMKEDVLMFQKYVTKLSQKQKKVEETRVAEEAQEEITEKEEMSDTMRNDIDKYMEIEKNFKERRAYNHGDGVSKRLTLLRKLASKAQK